MTTVLQIYRLADGKHIGSIGSDAQPPYEIGFTRQAVLVDKDFFAKLLSRPYLTRERTDSEKVDGTVVLELQPGDPGFLKTALSADLHLKGYLVKQTDQDN